MDKNDIIIAIDAGVNTGVAIYDISKGDFIEIVSLKILEAFIIVKRYSSRIKQVYVEDARQVKYKVKAFKAQGAGSVKRDCAIWEDFLTMYEIPSTFVRPDGRITKIKSEPFKKLTKWQGKTNEHSRDAAMIIFNKKGIL